MRVRTFVAVAAPDDIKTQAAELIGQLAGTAAHVKWVEPEKLHLTLKFLGDVNQSDIPEICSAVSDGVSPFPAMNLHCQGVGAFPDVARPRTIWIGLEKEHREFLKLHASMEMSLEQLGFRRERRRFHPHLTIGRLRDSRDSKRLSEMLRKLADYPLGKFPVSTVNVLSSELRPTGPVYTMLAQYRLGQ